MRFLLSLLFLAAPAAASGSPAIEVELPEDSSRALTHAILYEKELPYGRDYRCRFQVTVPPKGAAPLKTAKNRLVCSFTSRTGTEAFDNHDFFDTEVAGTGGDSFLMIGELALNLISVAYTTIRTLGDPIPASALWESTTKCDARGIECEQNLLLNTRTKGVLPVPVMVCRRHSILTAAIAKTRVDRAKFKSEGAYLDELIYRQILARERGMDSNVCGVLYDQTKPVETAPRAVLRRPDPRVTFQPGDLQKLTYVSRDPDGPLFKTAFNAYQFELALVPAVAQTLSDDATALEARVRQQGGQVDARLHPLQVALGERERLVAALPRFRDDVQRFLVMLSLIPDPDRYFLLAGVHWLEWKAVPEKEFLALLPERLRALGSQAATYRAGRTLYLNRGFIDGGHFLPRQSDGIEMLLLWESIKLWLSPGADFARLSERFSRAITQGRLDEIKLRDARGVAGLTFVPFVEELTRTMRATTAWPWLPQHAFYFGVPTTDGFEVEVFAPARIRSGDGRVTDTFSFQYLTARPGEFDYRAGTTYARPEPKLFCGEAASRASGSFTAEILPRLGRFSIRGLSPEWRGFREAEDSVTTASFTDRAHCETGLERALIRMVEIVSGKYDSGMPPFPAN